MAMARWGLHFNCIMPEISVSYIQYGMRSNRIPLNCMARIFDRRIGLVRSGQILYIGVGYALRFLCESSPRLHVCNTYRNILIILIMSDIGKESVVRNSTNFDVGLYDITGFP